MKRIVHSILLLIPLFNIGLVSAQVTTSGNAIIVDGERYTMRGVCYSPHSIGSTWQDYPDLGYPSYASFATDIQLMNSACINTIRTYYAIFDKTRLDQLYAAGIRVIITFPREDIRGGVNAADQYEMLDGTYKNYINTYKNHPAILMWSFGNEMNYTMNANTWYADLETAAKWVHTNDPNHPVTTANGEVPSADIMTNQSPSVDVWGANIYRFGKANTPLGDYYDRGGRKPFWYSEIGVDSYNHNTGGVDETSQATGLTSMWADIQYSIDNNGICSGATYFNWTDEWWKSGQNNVQNASGNAPAGIFYPDGVTDEEYYGILKVDRTPKAAYYALQNLWKDVCSKSNPATYVLEDFECNRHLGYTNYDGAFEIVNNPTPSSVNSSSKCVKYTRAQVQYAALVGLTPTLGNAVSFANKSLHPTLDVYSSKANVVVTLNLESSTDLGDPYPKGRYAVYTATTTKTNQWETLQFELQESRDATIDPTKVNQVAILFNAGDSADNGVYYFDNLKGPTVTTFTDLASTSIVSPTANTACVHLQNLIKVTIKNNSTSTINFADSRIDVSATVTGPKNQSFTTAIATGTLAAGASREVIITDELDIRIKGIYSFTTNIHAPGDNVCSNNTSPTLQLISDVCVGLEDIDNHKGYKIYPNPTNGTLNIDLDHQKINRIEILDAQGLSIKTFKNNSLDVFQIQLNDLENGIYLLKANTSTETITHKIQVIK